MMGRLRPWSQFNPISSRYRRLSDPIKLLDQSDGESCNEILEESVSMDSIQTEFYDGSSPSKKKKKTKKRSLIRRNSCKKTQQPQVSKLVEEHFGELMAYPCGQCGHVQTLQVGVWTFFCVYYCVGFF